MKQRFSIFICSYKDSLILLWIFEHYILYWVFGIYPGKRIRTVSENIIHEERFTELGFEEEENIMKFFDSIRVT